MIDPTINLGNILTAISFLVAGIVVIVTMRGDVKAIARRLAAVERELTELGKVVVTMARQDERLSGIDHRVNRQDEIIRDLQNGRGFIVQPPG